MPHKDAARQPIRFLSFVPLFFDTTSGSLPIWELCVSRPLERPSSQAPAGDLSTAALAAGRLRDHDRRWRRTPVRLPSRVARVSLCAAAFAAACPHIRRDAPSGVVRAGGAGHATARLRASLEHPPSLPQERPAVAAPASPWASADWSDAPRPRATPHAPAVVHDQTTTFRRVHRIVCCWEKLPFPHRPSRAVWKRPCRTNGDTDVASKTRPSFGLDFRAIRNRLVRRTPSPVQLVNIALHRGRTGNRCRHAVDRSYYFRASSAAVDRVLYAYAAMSQRNERGPVLPAGQMLTEPPSSAATSPY